MLKNPEKRKLETVNQRLENQEQNKTFLNACIAPSCYSNCCLYYQQCLAKAAPSHMLACLLLFLLLPCFIFFEHLSLSEIILFFYLLFYFRFCFAILFSKALATICNHQQGMCFCESIFFPTLDNIRF